MSKEIIDALEVTLARTEKVALTRRSISSLEAFDLYLGGRHALFRQTKANIEIATLSDIELIRKDSTCVALMKGELTARTKALLHRNMLGAELLDQPDTPHLLYRARGRLCCAAGQRAASNRWG